MGIDCRDLLLEEQGGGGSECPFCGRCYYGERCPRCGVIGENFILSLDNLNRRSSP